MTSCCTKPPFVSSSPAYLDDDDRVMNVEDWVVAVYTEAGAEYKKRRRGAVMGLDLLVKAQF